MSKRSLCAFALLAGLMLVSSSMAVPGPGTPNQIKVNGTIHIFKGKAVCTFDIQDPKTGSRVANCVVKVNNHPIPWAGGNPGYLAEFPVTFMAPQDFTITIKPPSPPFDANAAVVGQATIPNLAAFVSPQDNVSIPWGSGPGVSLMWRVTPDKSPAQIMLTDMTNNMNTTFEGIMANPYVLPWSAIPKGHSPFMATVRVFQNIHFKLTGSVATGSAVHGMAYGMVKFNVLTIKPGMTPMDKK